MTLYACIYQNERFKVDKIWPFFIYFPLDFNRWKKMNTIQLVFTGLERVNEVLFSAYVWVTEWLKLLHYGIKSVAL